MEITFQYTQDDYINAGRLHTHAALRYNYVFWVLLIGTAIASFFWSTFLYALPALIVIEVAMNVLQHYVVVPFSIKRQLKQNPVIFSSETTITQTDEGLIVESKHGSVKVAWDNIFRWKHDENSILLYMTSRMYYVIPKRLTEQGFEVATLIRTLHEQVGEPFKQPKIKIKNNDV